MRRRHFITVLGITVLGPVAIGRLAARAQRATKLARIGFLDPGYASAFDPYVDAFRAGLRDLGYFEGENIVIEFRWADNDYDRLPALAKELVRLNVEAIVTHGLPGVLAAKQATTTIPIVMAVISDAVRLGLVTSLNRPGGNLTGNSFFSPELHAKRLEFLKEALPDSRRVAVLFNPDNPTTVLVFEAMGLAAKSLNLELQHFPARRAKEFTGAFSGMGMRHTDGVVVVDDPAIIPYASSIMELATAQRLPCIGSLEIAEAGGLVAYAVDFIEMYRHTAVFVDKLLKGAKPDELPVEQPTRFKFVINLKTAKALGLTIPNLLFARADEVIE
jgi:putative ABC transport system substrate-binding protein